VYQFSTSGVTPFLVSSEGVSPEGITPTLNSVGGLGGDFWFTQSSGGNPGGGAPYFDADIGCITPAGQISEFPVPSSATAVPGLDGMIARPDGTVWFTETALNQIGDAVPDVIPGFCPSSGSSTGVFEHPLPAGNVLSPATAADSIASVGFLLYFAEPGSDAIGIMNTGGQFVKQVRLPAGASPLGVAAGPGKTAWFTEGNTSQIGSISAWPSTAVTEFSLPSRVARPWSIVADSDGDVWFTYGASATDAGVGCINPGFGPAQQVGMHPAPTPGANPEGITVSGNSIWFVESNTDRLASVSPNPGFSPAEFCGALPPAFGHDGIIQLPSNKPLRRVTVHVLPAAGLSYNKIIVAVNGKIKATTTHHPHGERVTLDSLPKGRFSVKVTVLTRTGGQIVGKRSYRSSR
jgi:virginiamycin B lyase